MPSIEEIKARFRAGQHSEALDGCAELCRQQPHNLELKRLLATMHGMVGNFGLAADLLREILAANGGDPDTLFNIGVCEREQRNFAEAKRIYAQYTAQFPRQWEGWVNLAECQFQLHEHADSLNSAETALRLNPSAVQALVAKADSLRALKRHEDALKCLRQADRLEPAAALRVKQGSILIELQRYREALDHYDRAAALAPDLLPARSGRADALNYLGRTEEAIEAYKSVLESRPDDEDTLKKISVCLAGLHRGGEAIRLCRRALEVNPSSLTAKLGISWLIDKIVPNWHVPMMNEFERNNAYYLAMAAAVQPDSMVFEIGAGSGLLSMMAAKLGATRVVTCEGAPLIAETAREIVADNGFRDTVTVLAKPSFEVHIPADLPRPAEVLVHEIFSSGLIEEHVLPAIEDAKRRLLQPGARIIPAAASIMAALVGGEGLGRYLHVKDPFGFDIRRFNAITPKKLPIFRADLQLELLSDEVEAFRFDFVADSSFPAEQKTLPFTATGEGLCYGIVQWIRLEMDSRTTYQNHPSSERSVSGWQHLVYRFDEPLQLTRGQSVQVFCAHDRATPWFDLQPAP